MRRPLLAGADPAVLPEHLSLVTAALGFCEELTDAGLKLAWAEYAHRVTVFHSGPQDPLASAAMLAYARALTLNGRPIDAYRLHRTRATLLAESGRDDQLCEAWRYLAAAEHGLSNCVQAVATIQRALTLWQHHRTPVEEGPRILASYTAILAGCGRTSDAVTLISRHPRLLPAPEQQETVAARIASVSCLHPPVCRRHPNRLPPRIAYPRLVAGWHNVLRHPPAPWIRAGGWR
ncbi:hypothetical protein ACQPZJ_44760 [Actinoplanes sp. CA-054009]